MQKTAPAFLFDRDNIECKMLLVAKIVLGSVPGSMQPFHGQCQSLRQVPSQGEEERAKERRIEGRADKRRKASEPRRVEERRNAKEGRGDKELRRGDEMRRQGVRETRRRGEEGKRRRDETTRR